MSASNALSFETPASPFGMLEGVVYATGDTIL